MYCWYQSLNLVFALTGSGEVKFFEYLTSQPGEKEECYEEKAKDTVSTSQEFLALTCNIKKNTVSLY